MTAEEIFRGEGDEIEFKQALSGSSKNYTRTVAAFSNGSGGKIVFGVEDGTWRVSGIPAYELSRTYDRITNAIYDSVKPTPSFNPMIQSVDVPSDDGNTVRKNIIVVEVYPGLQRPYYLDGEGKEDGVYIRVAGTTRRADSDTVRELGFQGHSEGYDSQVIPGEKVSDEKAGRLCALIYEYALEHCRNDEDRENIKPVKTGNLLSWNIIKRIGGSLAPTNAFSLLTMGEENVVDTGRGSVVLFPDAKIQCAVFKGTTRADFIDKKEYSGSLQQQVDDAYKFVLRNIRSGLEIDGTTGHTTYELPIGSIRELIANAVVHRSYVISGKIQVFLYDDRLEVTSPGMLVGGYTVGDLKTGISRPRNRTLAEAFSYMGIIEGYGSGIPRLIEDCRRYGLPAPELEEIAGGLRVNLFRRGSGAPSETDDRIAYPTDPTDSANQTNQTNQTNQSKNSVIGASGLPIKEDDLSDIEKQLLAKIKPNPSITQKQLAGDLGISINQVKYYTASLKEKGIIEREGSLRKGSWKLINS